MEIVAGRTRRQLPTLAKSTLNTVHKQRSRNGLNEYLTGQCSAFTITIAAIIITAYVNIRGIEVYMDEHKITDVNIGGGGDNGSNKNKFEL